MEARDTDPSAGGTGGMKRQEFVGELEAGGCELHRHGKRHDISLDAISDVLRRLG